MNAHLALASVSQNEDTKRLAAWAAILAVPTMIAGPYGMNFNTEKSSWNMPELNWYYGYPFAYALMVAVTYGLLGFFYRKGWIGRGGGGNRGPGRSSAGCGPGVPPAGEPMGGECNRPGWPVRSDPTAPGRH